MLTFVHRRLKLFTTYFCRLASPLNLRQCLIFKLTKLHYKCLSVICYKELKLRKLVTPTIFGRYSRVSFRLGLNVCLDAFKQSSMKSGLNSRILKLFLKSRCERQFTQHAWNNLCIWLCATK